MKRLLLLTFIFILAMLLIGCDSTDEIITPHEHTLVDHEGKAATCTEYGWSAYQTCSGCDSYSTYTVLSPLGHDVSGDYTASGDVHVQDCPRCGALIADEHTWSEPTVNEPTCTQQGSNVYTCTDCGAEKSEPIAALGHTLNDGYAPNGSVHSKYCTVCLVIVEHAPHTWESEGVSTEPGCTTAGEEAFVCTVCGAEKTEPIAPTGHTLNDGYAPNGSVHSKYCTVCLVIIEHVPHTWESEGVSTEPGCKTEGAEAFVCTVCGADKTEPIAPLGHILSYNYIPNGDVHSKFCTRCYATFDDVPHVWKSVGVITEPGCTTAGEEAFACTVCGAEKTETVAPLGHSPSDTYISEGDVHVQYCTVCSEVAATALHTWKSQGVTKEPTCTETGSELFKCTACTQTKTETLETVADAHTAYGWVTVTKATALEEGAKERRCLSCNKTVATERIPADVESLPQLYLEGNYTAATAAKNEVDMTVSYIDAERGSFDGYATIKVQGSSSAAYAKKNYTIKFFKDADHDSKYKVNLGWGKENKYVIKANWVDFSQARNVVSCRIWGNIVKTRDSSANQQKLASLKTNGGAVDGYPIAVYMNGVFHGLYTMNVPKDEWMLGMGEKDENGNKSATEALIAADDWNHTDFYSTIGSFVENSAGDIISENGGWELRYYGGDDHQWVADSFDALIEFCQNNDGDAFREGIANYLDVDAAIDYVIYMYANCMHDNASKNMLWATYDGKTWFPTVYDQDGTFGQVWDGVRTSNPNSSLPSVKNNRIDVGINYGPSTGNTPKFILWDRIWNCFTAEVLERYDELRSTILSTENMIAELQAFEALVPESLYEADLERWQAERAEWWAGKNKNTPYDYTPYHFDYMYDWIEQRMTCYDTAMNKIREHYGL